MVRLLYRLPKVYMQTDKHTQRERERRERKIDQQKRRENKKNQNANQNQVSLHLSWNVRVQETYQHTRRTNSPTIPFQPPTSFGFSVPYDPSLTVRSTSMFADKMPTNQKKKNNRKTKKKTEQTNSHMQREREREEKKRDKKLEKISLNSQSNSFG